MAGGPAPRRPLCIGGLRPRGDPLRLHIANESFPLEQSNKVSQSVIHGFHPISKLLSNQCGQFSDVDVSVHPEPGEGAYLVKPDSWRGQHEGHPASHGPRSAHARTPPNERDAAPFVFLPLHLAKGSHVEKVLSGARAIVALGPGSSHHPAAPSDPLLRFFNGNQASRPITAG